MTADLFAKADERYAVNVYRRQFPKEGRAHNARTAS